MNNDKAIHQGPTTTNYGDSTYYFVPGYNEGLETLKLRNKNQSMWIMIKPYTKDQQPRTMGIAHTTLSQVIMKDLKHTKWGMSAHHAKEEKLRNQNQCKWIMIKPYTKDQQPRTLGIAHTPFVPG